ncbi:MAG: signal peptide peptidase SppA [Rhodospirillaceae bacterium]|jgi:protease-4|nr:signal peptide peptidase SppA [Rhodospirillaceae bacterium]MBT5373384.1 signal peptide peptidase SppA [Rhodospirillaceae bacterium]MBT5752907.1 signal peptide peptidase SppA [Rhodospirillaceae bacterium]
MPLTSDSLIDRRRLKRHLILWRGAAVFAVLGLLIALVGEKGELRRSDQLARITINGVIAGDLDREKSLYDLPQDESTKALIVHIDSPGGTVVGGESLYHALRYVSEHMPVVIVMDEIATSAGYMTAIAGDRIFAREGTLTGSIGVIWQTTNVKGLLEKFGIQTDAIKSGKMKAEPSPFEPMTQEVREETEKLVLNIFDMFIAMVVERRRITPSEVNKIADGRVFTGLKAMEINLVDEIGGEREAIAWLESEKSIEADLPIHDFKIKREEQIWEPFLSSMFGKTMFSERVRLDGLISLWHAE